MIDGNGIETRERDGRKYWWVCVDVGDRGIRQLKLSFAKTPSGDTSGGQGDTTQGGREALCRHTGVRLWLELVLMYLDSRRTGQQHRR